MATVTDYLIQLQDLTKKNLEILQGINDSFFTKQNHLNINVGKSKYIIPSYIALENKINALEEGFNNLINAPKTGEAFFNFDGDSKSIEVRSYTTTPNSISLDTINNFNVEKNNIFKDFLTPKPFIKFDLSSLSDDITSVNVKKVIPIKPELKNIFKSKLSESDSSIKIKYSDIYKILSIYNKEDYIEYDTVMKMPIRKDIGHATYAIEKILENTTSETLEEFYTLKLRSDLKDYTQNLTYKLFDETIDVPLAVGDKLINYNGNAQVEIVEIRPNTNTIKVKVLHGDYTNFVESNNDDNISDYSKLKFFEKYDFNKDKYINVPLEEDQYIFVAIAPLNDRMNIQSSWGTGLILNTYTLKRGNEDFKTYYDKNVTNIGDILSELTSISTNGITKYSKDQYEEFTKYKPIINIDYLKVTQINNHLNNSETVKNIKSLYEQKMRLNNELAEIQKNISDANETLSKISFDDTTGRRLEIMSNISNWNESKNKKITAINKIINQISIAATNSDVPIENAKYRIRGFFDFSSVKLNIPNIENHLAGIKVQYRYKNANKSQGSAMSIDDKFIFSDWNIMDSFINPRIPSYSDKYNFTLKDWAESDKSNEPSCNQIDIPISQGESVDIKLKVIYDFGAPYLETTSDWSDIVNIEFPIEFTKDVQVLDIIKENNDDIETNRFNNILLDTGTSAHINDRLIDQNLTYFHKPESISSGFVTSERRIIPLKDKLIEMDRLITELTDIVKGSTSDALSISINSGDNINTLYPWQSNIISVDAYDTFNTFDDADIVSGVYNINGYMVSTVLNIVITNTSKHIVNLYSLFPGDITQPINKLKNTKYHIEDYSKDNDYGVWIATEDKKLNLQHANQFITFRIKTAGIDDYTYELLSSEQDYLSDKLAYNKSGVLAPVSNVPRTNRGMWMYPIIKNDNSLNIDNINNTINKAIAPGEQIIIPIMVQYNLDGLNETQAIRKTISFDLRTSLYTDPINYSFTVIAKQVDTIQDKVLSNNKKIMNNKYNISIE